MIENHQVVFGKIQIAMSPTSTEFPVMEKLHLRGSDLNYGLHLNSAAITKQFACQVTGRSGKKIKLYKLSKSLVMHLHLSSKGLKCL